MKTKLLLSSLIAVFIGSLATTAQTFDQVWMDYGNSEFNMNFISVSGQDAAGSTNDYDFTSDTPAIPLAPSAASKNAFKYVKSSGPTTSSLGIFQLAIDGGLEDIALTGDNTIVNIKITLYVVADTDGSTGVDLENLEQTNGNGAKITVQLRDDNTTATTRTSGRDLILTTGWQEIEFTVSINSSHATNLNQYEKLVLVLGQTVEDPSTNLNYYYDGTNFLNEDVIFYIDSVKSDIELDGTVLSVDTNTDTEASLLMFPNPVENTLFLSEEVVNAKIFNVTGTLIKESNTTAIDVTDLSSGMYMIQMNSVNGIKSVKRFIKK